MDGCIRTWTGILFPVEAPRPEHIHEWDLAHSMSNICRWQGQCSRFYSVAEHCVNVAKTCEALADVRVALYGLLHDAHEAFIGDIPTPYKRLTPEMQRLKKVIDKAIYAKFGLAEPTGAIYDTVKLADGYVGYFEDHALHHGKADMPEPPIGLGLTTRIPYNIHRKCYPEQARDLWLMHLRYLLIINGVRYASRVL